MKYTFGVICHMLNSSTLRMASLFFMLAIGLALARANAMAEGAELYQFSNGNRVVRTSQDLLAITDPQGSILVPDIAADAHETYPLHSKTISYLVSYRRAFLEDRIKIFNLDGKIKTLTFPMSEGIHGASYPIFRNFVFQRSLELDGEVLLKVSNKHLFAIDLSTGTIEKQLDLNDRKRFQIRRLDDGQLVLISRNNDQILFLNGESLEVKKSLNLNEYFDRRRTPHFNFPHWFKNGNLLVTTCGEEDGNFLLLLMPTGQLKMNKLPVEGRGICRLDEFRVNGDNSVQMIYGESSNKYQFNIDDTGAANR